MFVWLPGAQDADRCPAHCQPRLHDLRHTHASWLIEAGVNILAIQKRLGHTDIATTMGIYGHLAYGGEDPALAALDILGP